MKKILYFCIKLIIPALLLMLIISVAFFFYYLNKIPSIKNISDEGYEFASKLYTKEGEPIKVYANTTRYFIPLEDLPPHVIHAFLAAEDTNFYNNIGIDIKGILRATVNNIKVKIMGSSGYEGASTITQQLVKNILLTNERTLDRKIKEILLSIAITRHLSKDKILELYLNYIFLGYNAYGIESASLEYFNKHAKDLNIQEAATLASMPKAPSVINPRANYKRILTRRNWVIDRMEENNFISSKEANIAQKTDIEHSQHSKFQEIRYGYNAISNHIAHVEIPKLELEGLYTKGYFIKSTINANFQKLLFDITHKKLDAYQGKYRRLKNSTRFSQDKWCEELIKITHKYQLPENEQYGVALDYHGRYNTKVGIYNGVDCEEITTIALEHIPYKMGIMHLVTQTKEDITALLLPASVENFFVKKPFLAKPISQPNIGAVVMEVKTGKVLAMVGDYFDAPNGFNRATQASRQFGSTIKPIIYQAALENGFSPASKFIDAPITLGKNWKPENHSHDYLGSITLRKSLEKSRNIPTLRIADLLGLKIIKQTFARYGLLDGESFNLSSALGTTGITPLKAAEVYSTFPNGGKYTQASFIEYIQDRHGKTIYQHPYAQCHGCDNNSSNPKIVYQNQGQQLTSPQVAYQLTSMLEGVIQRGTASNAKKIVGDYVGGKTGTTNESKDSWFIGFNDKVIVAVYVGFDDATSLGKHEYGATLALPIFTSIMPHIIKVYPSEPFAQPFGIVKIAINEYTGKRVKNNNLQATSTIIEYFKTGDDIPKYENDNFKLYGY